ncbi:hypothetical protein PG996_001839 [Apiospora saccharicola]|uniref:Uncharacterized protein n=1 Tax=Apiospora saccharicola TaxID=335842 RepID=A0ABR1WM07_9PEZI
MATRPALLSRCCLGDNFNEWTNRRRVTQAMIYVSANQTNTGLLCCSRFHCFSRQAQLYPPGHVRILLPVALDRSADAGVEARQVVEQAQEALLHLLEVGQDLDGPVVDPRGALLGVVEDGLQRRRRGLERVPRPEGLVRGPHRFLLVRQRLHRGFDLVQRAPPSVQPSSSVRSGCGGCSQRFASAPALAGLLPRSPKGERGRFHLVQEALEPRPVCGADHRGARLQQGAPSQGAQAGEEVPVDLVGHRLAADEQELVSSC